MQKSISFSNFLESEESKEEPKVIAHIAGPTGSGKTTLLEKLAKEHKDINFKDLDEFDERAIQLLGLEKVPKEKFTEKMFKDLHKKKQDLLERYLRSCKKRIVFGGHHTEDESILDLHTDNLFLLDTGAEKSAEQACKRDKCKDKGKLLQQALSDISRLKKMGYKSMSASAISNWLEENI